MAKPTIFKRNDKGSALTFTEVDTSLQNLRDATISVNADGDLVVLDLNDTLSLISGTNISLSVTSAGAIVITNTQIELNTTYSISAVTDGPDANIRLTGSDSSTDDIQLIAGTNISLSVTSAGAIMISNSQTELNTTYAISASQIDDDEIKITLTGSDATTDDVIFKEGPNISLFVSSDGRINISAGLNQLNQNLDTDGYEILANYPDEVKISGDNGASRVIIEGALTVQHPSGNNTAATVQAFGADVSNTLVLQGGGSVNVGFAQAKIELEGGSNSNIGMTPSGTGVVLFQGKGVTKHGGITTADRDALSAQNGMIIYNSSTNKFQGRANGVWVDLH